MHKLSQVRRGVPGQSCRELLLVSYLIPPATHVGACSRGAGYSTHVPLTLYDGIKYSGLKRRSRGHLLDGAGTKLLESKNRGSRQEKVEATHIAEQVL